MNTAKAKLVATVIVALLLVGGVGSQIARQTLAKTPSATTRAATAVATAVAVGDRLRVAVDELTAPGKPTTVTPLVDDDGNVRLPYVGKLHVAGMTLADTTAAIARKYHDGQVISDPKVSVAIAEPHDARTTPIGPVTAGDQLLVRIWDLEDVGVVTTLDRAVDQAGNVDLPYVHAVHLGGQSEGDAAATIAEKLRTGGVITNATVEVIRKQAARR